VRFSVRFFITCVLGATVFCAVHLPTATAANQIMLGPVKKPLTNQDVVQMVKAKFADSTIVKVIQGNDSNFDLAVTALVALKTAGASQQVIEEMLSTRTSKKEFVTTPVATPPPPPPPTNPPSASPVAVPARALAPSKSTDLPDEVGMYLRQQGNLVTIDPEIVNWRTGGVLNSMATLGLDKGHVNGKVIGPHSKLIVSGRISSMGGIIGFYIHCPEGNSASEYQLLRLWEKSKTSILISESLEGVRVAFTRQKAGNIL